jgi:hypothetical protein
MWRLEAPCLLELGLGLGLELSAGRIRTLPKWASSLAKGMRKPPVDSRQCRSSRYVEITLTKIAPSVCCPPGLVGRKSSMLIVSEDELRNQ